MTIDRRSCWAGLLMATTLGTLTSSTEAKDSPRSSLLAKSTPLHQTPPGDRFLEDITTFEYNDLSQYSVRFERCQFVKTYEDEIAQDEDYDSPLAMKHFVVYRLCPTDTCEDSCDESNYGTYVTEVETYLESTIEYQTQAFEDMCENCDEKCNENGEYCSGCGKLCYNYENLEANGYIDASGYVECQELEYGDDDGLQLYTGPMCSGSNGQKITIGLFTDENCWQPYTELDVEDILGAKLSYHLISHASTDQGSVCLSCMEQEEDNNSGDAADYDDVNEMCEDLYEAAAKCESKTGIEGGFIQMNQEDGDYENQVENEFMVCTFIDSLLWNSYTETGEIDRYSVQDVVIGKTSPMQAFSLTVLSIVVVGLVAGVVHLRRRIENRSPGIRNLMPSNGQLA